MRKDDYGETEITMNRRVQNLQTGTSGDLIVYALEPGSVEREVELHEEFREERRSGEWFSASPELTKHVYLTGKRHRMLPPEHQFKVLQLFDRIHDDLPPGTLPVVKLELLRIC